MTTINNNSTLDFELGDVMDQVLGFSTPGDEIAPTINKVDAITTASQKVMFNEDGSVTEYGRALQKKNLNIAGDDGQDYVAIVRDEYVTTQITKGAKTTVRVLNMDEDASIRMAQMIVRSKVMDKARWLLFIRDWDAQGRKFGEGAIDVNSSVISMKKFIKCKSPVRFSKEINKIYSSNKSDIKDSVVYGDGAKATEFKVSYAALNDRQLELVKYLEEGVMPTTGKLIIDDFGFTKKKMIDTIVNHVNNVVVPTINESKLGYVADPEDPDCVPEAVSYDGDMRGHFFDLLEDLENITGIDRDVIRTAAMKEALYKTNKLLNRLFDLNKIGDEFKVMTIKIIVKEIEKVFKMLEKKSGEKIERDITMAEVVSFAYEATTIQMYPRGGVSAVESFLKGETFKNGLYINPFTANQIKRNKNVSDKCSDRAFKCLYKIFGNLMALNLKDSEGNFGKIRIAEKDLQDWMDQLNIDPIVEDGGYEDGVYVINSINASRFAEGSTYSVGVLDAVRDESGKIADYDQWILDYADEESEFKFTDKNVLAEVKKNANNFKKAKDLGVNLDYSKLVGKYVGTRNALGQKIVRDKNKVADARCYSVYCGQSYIGTTGNHALNGTVVAVIKNILIVEK